MMIYQMRFGCSLDTMAVVRIRFTNATAHGAPSRCHRLGRQEYRVYLTLWVGWRREAVPRNRVMFSVLMTGCTVKDLNHQDPETNIA